MSIPSKSSKLWRTLLVQSRLLQRASNNFDGACNWSGSYTLKGKGLLGTECRGFGTKGLGSFQKLITHEGSQPSRWLMQSGFSTEYKQDSGESDVDENDIVKPASFFREDNISLKPGTTIVDASFQIFVGNLPRAIKKKDLVELFSEYGRVLDAKVVYYQKDNKNRVFGFVHFLSKTEADSAVAALHQKEFRARVLVVKEGKAKIEE